MSIFNSVKGLRPKKNVFDLSHSFMSSMDMGQVIPVFSMQDIIPGSTVKVSTGQLTRFQALLAPIMHQIDAYITFWCVPYRLVDPNFADFISGKLEFENEEYNAPYITINGIDSEAGDPTLFYSGTLWDFLGYPCIDDESRYEDFYKSTLQMTPRPLVAYLLILKERYLNENVISGVIKDLFEKGGLFDQLLEAIKEGGDVSVPFQACLFKLRALSSSGCFPHSWNKDYFTSALPFTQIGEPVVIPLTGTAPVSVTGDLDAAAVLQKDDGIEVKTAGVMTQGSRHNVDLDGSGTQVTTMGAKYGDGDSVAVQELRGQLKATGLELEGEADLSEVSAISILELRIANSLQFFKELSARIGHRYYEYLQGTFGVVSQDARLQLPQWLASGKVPVQVSPVEQTSATSNGAVTGDTTPAGNLTGRGTAVGAGFCNFTMYAHEDCMILGLLYIQPKTMYGNRGVNRHLLKTGERFDFFHPSFEHVGEQEIKNCELFLSGTDAIDNGTFGYTARYAEYKHWNDEVHGQFNNVLAFWHMARIFNTTPTLSPDFLYIKQEDVTRPFAVQKVTVEGQEIPLNNTLDLIHFKVKYKAPMSYYGTPALRG